MHNTLFLESKQMSMQLELPGETRQTELNALSEKIREARGNSRSGIYLNLMGATVISVGIILNLFTGQDYAVFCALIGLIVIAIGFYFAAKYAKIRSGLMREFDEIVAQIPKCTSCGEELPQGDFWACPFCGKSLKSENAIVQAQLVTKDLESSLLS